MNSQTFYVARSGYKGAITLLICMLLSFVLGFESLAFLCLCFLLVWVFLFRNPERLATHISANAFLSPADGRIEKIETRDNETRIVIKVGILDAGVLRSPVNIDQYQVNATFGSPLWLSSKGNLLSPQSIMLFGGCVMQVTQNLFHIFPFFSQKSFVRGERMGFLKAGRIELQLKNLELKVNVGDKVRGGESVIGYLQ